MLFWNFNAQNSKPQTKADILEHKFSIAKLPREKALLQMELSDYWSFRDTAKAFRHLEIANKFVGQDEYLKGLLLFYKGGIYFDQNITNAQKNYKEADSKLKNYKTKEAFEFRAKLWHNFATLEQIKGDEHQFLEITVQKCIPFAEKSGNNLLLSGYYVDVGMIFYNFKEYQKSISYYNRAIEILKNKENNNEAAVWAYLNLANTYLETRELDKMKIALDEADTYLKSIPESQYNSYSYVQKSKYYNKIGNRNKALDAIQKGIAFSKKMNLDYDVMNLNFEKYLLLKDQKKYTEAKEILLQLLLDKKFSGSTKNRLMFLNQLADLEKTTGNYQSALQYKEQFLELNDSVQKENEKLEIFNLETQYKSKEQQKSLEHLGYKNRLKNIIITISTLLFLVTILFLIYALKQRKKENEQKLAAVDQQRKNEIENALYEGEVQERERIAKDLHDGIGGRITGIKIAVENLSQKIADPELNKMAEQLEICLSELRNTSRNLTPETLKKFGLEEAIKDYCLYLNSANCKISCYTKNLQQCKDIKKQINIFHLVQETVNNAVKHSESTEILVQCTIEDALLMIDIEDNGKGFSIQEVKRNLGLNNIEKRVRALNGKFDIQTSAEKGTTVMIEAKL